MGMYPKHSGDETPAANQPDPARFTVEAVFQCPHAHAIKVRYHGCTTYEGLKIMVLPGQWHDRRHLDPHFSEDAGSPLARFRPTEEGWAAAMAFALGYEPARPHGRQR